MKKDDKKPTGYFGKVSHFIPNKDRRDAVKKELASLKGSAKAVGHAADSLLMIVTSVAGAFIAKGIGRPAAWVGAGVTVLGGILKQPLMMAGGGTMIAAGIANPIEKSDGLSGVFDKAKERLKDFKENLLHNTYISNFFKKKEEAPSEDAPVSGLGLPPMNSSGLDEVEQQLVASAMEFQAENPDLSDSPVFPMAETMQFEEEPEVDFADF